MCLTSQTKVLSCNLNMLKQNTAAAEDNTGGCKYILGDEEKQSWYEPSNCSGNNIISKPIMFLQAFGQ